MRTLIFTSMMLIALASWSELAMTSQITNVHAGKAKTKNLAADNDSTEKSISKDQGYFAYMARPEWLVVGSDSGEVDLEVHLPRIESISELTWSPGNRYLTFTTKDRELWLFDLQHRAISLLESVPASHPEVKYLPQWSGKKQWLLFVSHKNVQSRPRIYSPVRRHSYALPLSANQVSSITWAYESDVITVSNYAGNAQHIDSFNAFGITIEQISNNNLTALNN